jgi:Ca2+-binding EF-hand superfamily protein
MLLSVVFMISACSSGRTVTQQDKLQGQKREFAQLDLNHDGVISSREWAIAGVNAGSSIPKVSRPDYVRRFDSIFMKLDKNGDGNITFDEFAADNLAG